MKILITGKYGYIARYFAEYAKKTPHETKLISLRGQGESFTGYDAVLHTAGMVHIRETRRNQYDFYLINRDLAVHTAEKAKKEGVRQFVYLSSMNVYGPASSCITLQTPANPKTHYGRSKLAAEKLLEALATEDFTVAILRPPMVYGPDCPGNFRRLVKLVEKTPYFPNFENARSMVYIYNLCAHICNIIEEGRGGLFFPQDPYPICTRDMAAAIAEAQGKKLRFTSILNPFIQGLMPHAGFLEKMFGSLVYDAALPSGGGKNLAGFPESVKSSV